MSLSNPISLICFHPSESHGFLSGMIHHILTTIFGMDEMIHPCWTPLIIPLYKGLMFGIKHIYNGMIKGLICIQIYIQWDQTYICIYIHPTRSHFDICLIPWRPPWRLMDVLFITGWSRMGHTVDGPAKSCITKRMVETPKTAWWLTYPSEKWWTSSLGMMKFPTEWKNNPNVPNHQPDILLFQLLTIIDHRWTINNGMFYHRFQLVRDFACHPPKHIVAGQAEIRRVPRFPPEVFLAGLRREHPRFLSDFKKKQA